MTATTVEWQLLVPGRPEPVGVIRRVRCRDERTRFRLVTWAETSEGRTLVGRYETGDKAAEVAWRRYCDEMAGRHEIVSRMHGGRERGGLREA